MNRKILVIVKIALGLSFLVPLVALPSSYIFPFIVPKIVLFRSLLILMFGGYILLLISNWREYRVKLTPMTWSVALFFVSFAISTFVGVDWYRSFWDNHERMLGLFTIFHFVAYYLIITSIIKEWRDWKWFLRFFLIAGSIVMFVGLLQKFNPDMLLNNGSSRVSATLGNPIYFSGYGLFLFFIGAILFFKEKGFWRYVVAAMSLFGFWGIFGGGTRGTFLGLLVGLFVLGVCYLIVLKDYKKIRLSILFLMIAGIALLSLAFVFRKTNFVKNFPAVGRLVTLTIDSHTPRIMAWGIALDAWKERPILGWGPNNYFYAFNKYFRPQFLESGWGETWFDNAHNIVLNTLATQGGIGLALYFGLFGVTLFSVWRSFRHHDLDAHTTSLSTAFLSAHFVHNITVFENPTSYLYFFFFLAFINSQTSKQSIKIVEKNTNRDASVGYFVIVGVFVCLMIYSTNINPARANQTALSAIRALYSNPELSIKDFNTATQIPSPHIDDIRNDFSRTSMQVIGGLSIKDSVNSKKLFSLSYDGLKQNLLLHPMDIRIHLQLAQLCGIGFQLWRDPNLFLEAEKLLDEALLMSPKRQQIQYTLSILKLGLGKGDEALALLKQSVDNDPKISESWWRLALAYQQIGKIDEAKETIKNAEAQGLNFDSTGQEIANVILSSVTQTNKK